MLSYVLMSFLVAGQKSCRRRSWRCGLLFLPLEERILVPYSICPIAIFKWWNKKSFGFLKTRISQIIQTLVLFLGWYFWLIFIKIKISCLNPDSNCFSSFTLSWVDGLNTAPYGFVSVIANVPAPAELVITQFCWPG